MIHGRHLRTLAWEITGAFQKVMHGRVSGDRALGKKVVFVASGGLFRPHPTSRATLSITTLPITSRTTRDPGLSPFHSLLPIGDYPQHAIWHSGIWAAGRTVMKRETTEPSVFVLASRAHVQTLRRTRPNKQACANYYTHTRT